MQEEQNGDVVKKATWNYDRKITTVDVQVIVTTQRFGKRKELYEKMVIILLSN